MNKDITKNTNQWYIQSTTTVLGSLQQNRTLHIIMLKNGTNYTDINQCVHIVFYYEAVSTLHKPVIKIWYNHCSRFYVIKINSVDHSV